MDRVSAEQQGYVQFQYTSVSCLNDSLLSQAQPQNTD